jgi:hypothetical protein
MSRHSYWLTVAILTLALPSFASAEVLCQNKVTGALYARGVCKPAETTIDPAAVGLVGPPGPPGPAGPAGPPGRPLEVRDSLGQVVGVFLDAVAIGRVARRIDDQIVVFLVHQGGFFTQIGITKHFETGDCTGTPFTSPVFSDPSIVPLYSNGTVHGTILYYPGLSSTLRTILSQLDSPRTEAECADSGGTFVPPDGCCRSPSTELPPPNNTVRQAPLLSVDVSTFGLVPPFRLEGL